MAIKIITAAGGPWGTAATWNPSGVPVGTDDIIALANSGALAITVSATCNTINLDTYTSTISGTSNLNIGAGGGNTFYVPPTATWSATGPIQMNVQAGVVFSVNVSGKTIVSGMNGGFVVNSAPTGHVTFTGDINIDSDLLVTQGVVDFPNNFVVGCRTIAAGVGTLQRAFNFNSSNIRMFPPSTSLFTGTSSTNMLWNIGNSTITIVTGSPNIGLAPLPLQNSFFNLQITGDATATLFNVNTTGNLVFTGGYYFNQIFTNGNFNVGNIFRVQGPDENHRIVIFGPSNRTTDKAYINAASYTFGNCDFSDVVLSNVSPAGFSVGDLAGCSNITFSNAVSRYWVGGNGNWVNTTSWATTSGGASGASVPLTQDRAIFDGNSFLINYQTAVIGPASNLRNFSAIDATHAGDNAVNSTINILVTNYACYGDFIFGPNVSFTDSSGASIQLKGPGTHTFKVPGSSPFTVFGGKARGTYVLGSDLISTSQMTINTNVINPGFNVTTTSYQINASDPVNVYMGPGTLTCNGTVLLSILASANQNVDFSQTSIVLKTTAAGNKTFDGGGKSFANVTLDPNFFSASANVVFTGNNTYGFFNVPAGRKVKFTPGYVNTFTRGQTWVGNSTANISITSATQNTTANLIGVGVIRGNWLNLQDINIGGTGLYYAGANSININNNSGWAFTASPGKNRDGVLATDIYTIANVSIRDIKSINGQTF